jgi:hypothetical protein
MGANAQTAVPTFTASQVLTAAEQNNSARTGVPVFASTTTRNAAFGGSNKTLAEGQLCYVEGVGLQTYNAAGAWVTWGTAPSTSAVVQVKSTAKTDTFSTASTTYTDITGLSVSITPTSASNKILVMFTANVANIGAYGRLQLVRGTTAIAVGDAAGSRIQASSQFYDVGGGAQIINAMTFLDSPATTSATTYKVQISTPSSTAYVNRSQDDTDANTRTRTISTITVMEVTP